VSKQFPIGDAIVAVSTAVIDAPYQDAQWAEDTSMCLQSQ
jgi:hypothetical protein